VLAAEVCRLRLDRKRFTKSRLSQNFEGAAQAVQKKLGRPAAWGLLDHWRENQCDGFYRAVVARAPQEATPPRPREAWWTRGVSLPDASCASDRKDSIPRAGRMYWCGISTRPMTASGHSRRLPAPDELAACPLYLRSRRICALDEADRSCRVNAKPRSSRCAFQTQAADRPWLLARLHCRAGLIGKSWSEPRRLHLARRIPAHSGRWTDAPADVWSDNTGERITRTHSPDMRQQTEFPSRLARRLLDLWGTA